MTTTPPKLCKDCRWCNPKVTDENFLWKKWQTVDFKNSLCMHETSKMIDLLEGRDDNYSCSVARSYYGNCGKEGKLWEAKS